MLRLIIFSEIKNITLLAQCQKWGISRMTTILVYNSYSTRFRISVKASQTHRVQWFQYLKSYLQTKFILKWLNWEKQWLLFNWINTSKYLLLFVGVFSCMKILLYVSFVIATYSGCVKRGKLRLHFTSRTRNTYDMYARAKEIISPKWCDSSRKKYY